MSRVNRIGGKHDLEDVDYSDSPLGNKHAGKAAFDLSDLSKSNEIFDEYFDTPDDESLPAVRSTEESSSLLDKAGEFFAGLFQKAGLPQSSAWNSEELLNLEGVDLGLEDFDLDDFADEVGGTGNFMGGSIGRSLGNAKEHSHDGCEHDDDHCIK